MPGSISSTRVIGADPSGALVAVSSSSTLAELSDLVPAPYRPRMRDIVNTVYKAAVKSNHARSYLSTLEKHQVDRTFPPEIGGRVRTPALQISKEYEASSECKSRSLAMDDFILTTKKSLLASAISIKKEEVIYLSSLFSETEYVKKCDAVLLEVTRELIGEAASGPDGSISDRDLPPWIQLDYLVFKKCRHVFPQRAVALAYASVSAEMSKKFKSLQVKASVDEDVEMQDSTSKTDTVEQLVSRKFEQLRKELKIPGQVRKGFAGEYLAGNLRESTSLLRAKFRVSREPGRV
ncbi:MAG: hypothetical protein L6R37_008343 [Teloschistes peruensis]|nr:MAG: hypothetical protein L6R37_008343 [Teloschistes peruensis]